METAAVRVTLPQGVPLLVDYDQPADVLYVVLGDPVPLEGTGRPGGIELDYAVSDDSPCAVTVIGFRRHGWDHKGRELSKIISDHLNVAAATVSAIVRKAVTL